MATDGHGRATANVGMSGAAIGINNNTIMIIAELLSRTNARARKGLVWDADGNGTSSSSEGILRNQAHAVFSAINNS